MGALPDAVVVSLSALINVAAHHLPVSSSEPVDKTVSHG